MSMEFEPRSEAAKGKQIKNRSNKFQIKNRSNNFQIIGNKSSKPVNGSYAWVPRQSPSLDNFTKREGTGIRGMDKSIEKLSIPSSSSSIKPKPKPICRRGRGYRLQVSDILQLLQPHPNLFPHPANSFITNAHTGLVVRNRDDVDLGDRDDADLEDLLVDLKYPKEPVQEDCSTWPLPSRQLDVINFLSNRGMTTSLVRFVPHEAFPVEYYDINQVIKGKYVVIACFSIPLLTNKEEADCARAMIASYSELASSHDFEMVVVVKFKKGFEDNIGEYLRFVAAFPCLAVPFEDRKTRESICSSIWLHSWSDCSAISVDPDGTVLQYKSTPINFLYYGSEAFPFDDSSIDRVTVEDEILNCRLDPFYRDLLVKHPPSDDRVIDAVCRSTSLRKPLSLCDDILLCSPSFKLDRVGPAGGSIRVSELCNKFVGLYLCVSGDFLSTLQDVHQQCILNNRQLEIVVVCLPISEDVEKHYVDLHAALRYYNITSWLLFPYKNNVSRRLWRTFGLGMFDDNFIILPPNSNSGELEGKAVITGLGLDQYPFTRTSIRERRLASLKLLTPISLFRGTSTGHTCLVSPHGVDHEVYESQIRGKRLLVYLDWLSFMEDERKLHRKLYHLLEKFYPDIQRHGCEVVFVPLDVHVNAMQPHFPKMQWPYMPISAAVKNSVARQLIFKDEDEHYNPHIMAFEKDGRILSRKVEERLIKHGFGEHLFEDKLYDEITIHLNGVSSFPGCF